MTKQNEKSLDTSHTPPELVKFRKAIDRMDEQIIDLLKKRSEVVQQVGEYKTQNGTKGCFIRAGREADMLRRIWQEFDDEAFSSVAAVAIWRQIIAASTRMESKLRISVFCTNTDETLYWLAREYFGPFTEVIKQPNVNRVVGDVVDGKAEVGMLPPVGQEEANNWWLTLAQQEGENAPQLFAHVPFVVSDSDSSRYSSYAIGKLDAEPTDADVSLAVVEAIDVSTSRLVNAFTEQNIKASHMQFVNNPSTNSVYHLLELEGFFEPQDARIGAALSKLEEGIVGWKALGAYAAPIRTAKVC